MGNDNIIIVEININENEINKDIRIINSFEEVKRNKHLKDNKDDYKLENEKEIKECKIKINNKIIPFTYFNKFNKKGKYKIEYYFSRIFTKIDYIFNDCNELTNINLSNFNTENVNNMTDIFGECYSLTNINLYNLNTQNVTDMSFMFCDCSSLTNIDLSNFNTNNITVMRYMFAKCSSLTNIDLSKFNTNKVIDMKGML